MDPQLLADMASLGWTSQPSTLSEVRSAARALGWVEGPVRRGSSAVETLRPLAKDEARPYSMSAFTGLGEQPLHTDGAHLIRPPDVIALAATERCTTATRLWPLGRAKLPSEVLRRGVFRAATGCAAFLCSALDDERARLDPCCMIPCDRLARRVLEHLAAARSQAAVHTWKEPKEVLIIDNRQVLHARDAVGSADRQRAIERVAFWIPESS